MHPVSMPYPVRILSPRFWICEIPSTEKVIYLTFDDGPIPDVTPEILSILESRKAKATFFCVGDNARKHPDELKMVISHGHTIGNHTFSHLNGWKTPPGGYIENVERCRDYFATDLFRPTYGRFGFSQYLLLRKKYRFVLWSVLTWDFHHETTPEQCLRYAVDYTHAGSVVVFHDSLKSIDNVRYALPRFLDHFLEKGYRFEEIRL